MGTIRQELALALRHFSNATTIALAVVLSTFAGVITGYYLDIKFFEGKTYPWLTILFFLFGLGGGIKNFIILTKRFTKEAEKKDGERKGTVLGTEDEQHQGDTDGQS
ncbi:MAG: AtpZ/AtpI family protein [Thermodesulfobacteria bacterium]|nr:AtpZ/AtpI family protein [Thermodesulfobacteriota bacterium]